MIEIEFEEPNIYDCECCSNKTVRLTRFVYKDDDAYAVYYCQYTIGHKDKVVTGVISLGEWWEESVSPERVAFPFRIWTDESNYQIGLMDKEDCIWKDIEILGNMLDREVALKHKWIKEVFQLTDHIVDEDQYIIDYLE
ncbi:hypothetical protein [Flammeovirga aprica]|uniref:Uncharacterized protein n=1 Tax=Flammeovirga aprica JL-4 TaxID=694437 RepID=A0A7X9XDG2_9BACT|nr:hypothetical protein [Flammeovirga aprica]NME72763.1 hypothetical protein [Flammeovirga aprica JL-4]